MGLEKIGCYVNGNHRTVLFADGTKVKQTGHWVDFDGEGTRKWEDDDQDHFTYDFPENFDLKITDYCDGGCRYCFPVGTKIKYADGSIRSIEQVNIGDKVASYDVRTSSYVDGIVTKLFNHQYDGDLVGIEVETGITWCTPNHKVLTSNRGLVRADELTLNDNILTI